VAVFISYSHRDTAVVERLVRELLKRKVKVWRDVWKNLPGDAFASRIESALAESTSACFFVPKSSRDSAWVQRELKFALARAASDPEFLLVPVLLDESEVPPPLGDRLAVDWRDESDDALKRLLSALTTAESKPTKGRVAVDDRYFTLFGVDERQSKDGHVVLLDVVSFDIEETFCVLTQFEFRVTGEKAWLALGLSGPEEIKAHLLRTCAGEFASHPAVVKLTAREPKTASFTMSDAEGTALAQAQVRVTTLGEGPRSLLVFDCGALIDQVCRTFGFLPSR